MKRKIIVTEFYDGQGLGNQLWLYVATRCKAAELGVGFGIKSPEKFKGFSIFDLDFGEQITGGYGPEGGPPSRLPDGIENYFRENLFRHPLTHQDITTYSSDWKTIKPSTKIDGNFQGEKYIESHKKEIKEWLQVIENKNLEQEDEDVCIINFRGGEYTSVPEVFLPKQYWEGARRKMLEINPKMKFKVVTDDEKSAKKFFKKNEISNQTLRQDYLDIYNAKYLIIANTSFAWFPSWLSTRLEICIAPKYWWGYNTGEYWACGYSLTSTFNYLDKQGKLWTSIECTAELLKTSPLTVLDSAPFVNDIDPPSKTKPSSKAMYEPSKREFNLNLFANGRAFLKRVVPKIVVIKLRFLQSFFRRQRISIFNERIDPLVWFESPLSKMLAKHHGKIYDCFYFFNELDILEIRMEILSSHVDKFVIFESSRTFTGIEKESYFLSNRERFKKFDSQIVHYWLDDAPLNRESVTTKIHDRRSSRLLKIISSNTLNSKNVPSGPGNTHWVTEAFQKEALHLPLEGLEENDLVFISDVDEIWNPNARIRFKEHLIYVFKQIPYMYKLNNRSNEHWHNWTGSMLCTYGRIKNSCINDLRTHGRFPRIRVLNGGWHFSFQAGSAGVREKLLSYGHQEINTPEVHAELENTLRNNKDVRGRGAKFSKSEEGLPPFLLANMGRYRHMFLE